MEGGIVATAMATSVDSTGKSAASAVTMATIVAGIEMAGDGIAMNEAMGTAIGAEIVTETGTGDAMAIEIGTSFALGGIASWTMKATVIVGISGRLTFIVPG